VWSADPRRCRSKQALPDLAGGEWKLTDRTWQDTGVLAWYDLDPDFSIHRFLRRRRACAPVVRQFRAPAAPDPTGFDTFDLLLDLVATPDIGRWSFKDADEYAHGRRLGVVSDADHHRVREARERAVALLEGRGGPFAEAWPHWRPAPDRPTPAPPTEDQMAT
jgi:hypothetical protein